MTVAVDTSVAVPLLVRSHHDHADVVRWWNGQEIALSGHALADLRSALGGKLSSDLDVQVLLPHPAGKPQKGAL